MERNLNTDDFEQFLKLKTDQYKLYPSESVWKGIYRSLHARKWWFTVGGASLLFLTAMLITNYQFSSDRATAQTKLPASSIKNTPDKPVEPVKAIQPVREFIITSSFVQSGTGSSRRKFSGFYPLLILQASSNVQQTGFHEKLLVENLNNVSQDNLTAAELSSSIISENAESIHDPKTSSVDQPVIVNEDPVAETQENDINWLQEMAAMQLTRVKKSKFNIQFYFSPTISYRKLTDGTKNISQANMTMATNHLGVNELVDHKPSVGLEIGSNVLYSPTRNLILKSGLQFNYSRYNIKAYKYYFEKANIALTTVGRIADTMSSYTSIRNLNGYSPESLQNQYLQVSLPIGAELKLLGNHKLQLNIAGTLQPTYLLYNDTYLLSTDFINYTKEPSLLRKWNVHTSAEAFIAYYVGGMRWQLGPQFRYQTLSSYTNRYPIREYLIEYGVKFGVSKTLK